MCVRFYVLNHSKYRFPFHAVYIGIMNGIRKPTFHAARYNRVKYLGSDVRSRPLQSAPMDFFCPETVVILHREPTRLRKPQRRIFETLVRDSPARIFVVARQQRAVPLSDKLAFVRQRCSLCEAGWRSRVTPPYNLRYDKFKKEDRTPDNDRSQSPQV